MQSARSRCLLAALLTVASSPLCAWAEEPTVTPAVATAPEGAVEPVTPVVGFGFVNPVQAPASLRDLCDTTPMECRQHVRVYLVNGCDPLCVGNMNGLCAYVKSLGFSAEFSQMYSARWVHRRAKQAKECDPDCKIVLMGYSLGANTVRCIAQMLNKDGITVDLLYYLAADAVSDGASTRPDNVQKIVNVTGHGSPFFGGDAIITPVRIAGAENIHLDAAHFAMPAQPQVVDTLVRELLTLAGGGQVVPAPTTIRGASPPEPETKTLRIP